MRAGASDRIVGGAHFDKLESVSEGMPVPDHGVDLHIAERERQVQSHDLANWDLYQQHG
jgi:hypothetical protein